MSYKISVLFAFFLTLFIVSCTPEHSKIVVAEFNETAVTMSEFEDAYSKNVGGWDVAAKDSFENYKNFADLYVNFRMKLKDANERNYKNDSALTAELLDYKKKVGSSFILEKYLVEPNIKDWYEKRKVEIRASHIMFRHNPAKEDSIKLFAQSILDSIKKGSSFEEMAKKYSEDQYSKPKGGDIFYFTAGQLPYEFEEACYKTAADSVHPALVNTTFGYHIIKVTENQPRIPKVHASHILASFVKPDGTTDSLGAKLKIDSVVAALKAGESFGNVAKKFSDDPGSKDKEGDLGFFERRMMIPEFEEAAFNLEVGQVSDIVTTNYGYHIIKMLEKGTYPSFDDDRENLKNLLKRSRYNQVYNELINEYKKIYGFSVNETIIQQIIGYNDTTVIGEELKGVEEIGNKTIFSYTSHIETVNAFYEKLRRDTEFSGKKFNTELINKAVKKFSETMLLEEKALVLDKTDAQFAELMQDYQNGIFIFKLQEEEVWNKVEIDSIKLHAFYEQNMQKYVLPERVGFTEIFARKDSVINHYYNLLKAGDNFDTLAAKTERLQIKDKKGKYDLQAIDASEFAKMVSKLNVGDYTEPFSNPGGFSILKLDIKDPSRLKTFEEAKAEVSGGLQESESKRLETEYVDSLKKKYLPIINYDELRKAFNKNDN